MALQPNGAILRVNRTFCDWTGYARQDLVGRRLQTLLRVGDRIYYETHLAPMLMMEGQAQEIAVEVLTASGDRLPMLLNAAVGQDGESRTVVRVALFKAASRRSYERELLAAKRRAEESERAARQLAETLQASLIPPIDPIIPGLDVGAAYRPAGAGDVIGGDFYDVFQVAGRRWMVVIGDVCGKGIEAATLTGYARYTVRGASMEATRPGQVLHALNEAFRLDHPGSTCTVLAVTVTVPGDGPVRFELAAAGHPLPFHGSAGGRLATVGAPGTLIGAFPDPVFREHAIEPLPGDALVLFTDGVTEARHDAGFYGPERLQAFVAKHGWDDAAALAGGLADDAVQFQGGEPRDDIAAVVLRYPA